jgi:tellurite resistance protein
MPEAFLPKGPIAETQHADTLLELAFLMAAVDGRLADEELAAFKKVVGAVRGKNATEADVGALVERFAGHVERAEIEARVRQIAPSLPAALREDAFRVGIGLALSDRDADAHEDALMGVFFEALGLTEERAEAIASEVRKTFA